MGSSLYITCYLRLAPTTSYSLQVASGISHVHMYSASQQSYRRWAGASASFGSTIGGCATIGGEDSRAHGIARLSCANAIPQASADVLSVRTQQLTFLVKTMTLLWDPYTSVAAVCSRVSWCQTIFIRTGRVFRSIECIRCVSHWLGR
jgi:hypothetical protein